MRTSFVEINEIFKTLPVGYYLGRKINHTLSETSGASYYNPEEDTIIISYPTIADMIGRIDEKFAGSKESIVRGLLYHEISHVILTPAKMKSYACTNEEADAINIVEDERIETILANYYMDVNFKRNIILANNWHGEEGQTLFAKFYNLVRFRQGEKCWLNRLEKVLETGEEVVSSSESWESSYYDNSGKYISIDGYNNYVYAILSFYRDFMQAKQQEQEQEKQNSNSNSDSNNTDNNDTNNSENNDNNDNNNSNSTADNDSVEDNNNNNSDTNDNGTDSDTTDSDNTDTNNDTSNNSGNTNDDNDSENTSEPTEEEIKEAEKEIEDLLKNISKNTSTGKMAGKEAVKAFVRTTVNKYYDVALEDRLEHILTTIMKRRANSGASISSYSGHMNIRAVGTRDDYRWWTTGNRNGHLKTTTKVHFNLFIDNSGSFSDNDDATNTLIKALDRLSRKFTDFTFDVITINTRINEWKGHNQIFASCGGTELSNDIKEVLNRHQKSNARNINIILFDGEAHSRCDIKREPFRHFNNIDTFIISDYSNRRYIDPVITKAKVTYCNDYCTEFINTVCTQLEKTL